MHTYPSVLSEIGACGPCAWKSINQQDVEVPSITLAAVMLKLDRNFQDLIVEVSENKNKLLNYVGRLLDGPE